MRKVIINEWCITFPNAYSLRLYYQDGLLLVPVAVVGLGLNKTRHAVSRQRVLRRMNSLKNEPAVGLIRAMRQIVRSRSVLFSV